MTNALFILTEEKLADWQAEKKRGEEMIAEGQRLVVRMDERLIAAARLMETSDAIDPMRIERPSEAANEPPTHSLNLTLTVEELANQSLSPIAQAELRTILTKRGFPDSQLSNYFYTVISRLKKQRRITSTARGVWKAEPEQTEFNELRTPGALSPTGDRLASYSDAGNTQTGEPRAQGREAGPGGGT